MELINAVVLVTGASSGIGAATAIAAGKAGARVVLLARREDRIQQIATALPDALAIRCDATDTGDVASAVQQVLDRYGRIDVLINNAGVGLEAPAEQIELQQFRTVLELNLLAPLSIMQAVLPTMHEQGAGSIVNVSSGVTFAAVPGSGAYAASKAALNQLTAVARVELAEAGITVSTVLPSATKTEFFTSALGAQAEEEDLEDAQTPEEVAAVLLDLIRSGAATADLVPVEFGGSYAR